MNNPNEHILYQHWKYWIRTINILCANQRKMVVFVKYGTFEFPQRLQNSGTLKGSCRTVALRKFFLLTDRRATVPHVVKTVYLLRRISCARFGLNFSIFLLCQVKIQDEKNTRHVYLFGKNINKHLVHFN